MHAELRMMFVAALLFYGRHCSAHKQRGT